MATFTTQKWLFVAVFISYHLQLAQVSALPTIGFASTESTVSEASVSPVTISLERTIQTNITTTVTVEISGTAVQDSDYVVSGSLVQSFAVGETKKDIKLFILNDQDVESGPPETIVLTIKPDGSFNTKSGFGSHTVKIQDDDVNIVCENTQVLESAGKANITITRSGSSEALSNSHTIGCFTKDDTAKQPRDYTKANSAISFTNTSNVQQMSITIQNDDDPENNETLKVECFTSDVRVRVQSSCKDAVATIQNDDTYVFFCPGYSTSIEENVGSFTVRVCRVGVLEATHTVKICRTSDSVPPPHDYPSVQAQCDDTVFAAYDDIKELVIPVTNDSWGEQEYKTFNISMNTTDSRVELNGTTSYIVTIHDDDNTFYLTNVTVLSKTEGVGSADVNVTINRVGRISEASNVSLELVFDATAEIADCTGTSSRVIQFDANVTSRTITACTVVDDRLVEDDETFKVTISGVAVSSNVRTGESERTIKLISDDVNITCQGASLKEANGPAIVRLNRTGATAITANNIQCSTANGTAISPTDYQPETSATVSINDTLKHFPVVLINDKIVEGNETFTVTCNTSDSRVVVDPSCTGVQMNIINDDTYVYFCPGYSTSFEENVGSYTVRLCRVGVLEDTHTVKLCRSSDSVSSPHDYPSVQAQCDDIVFAAYDEVKEHVIPVNNDTWGEQEYKTFNISMNTTDVHVTFNETTSYVVTIHDDDNTFCFTRTSATVYEERDKFVNLTIRRTGEILMSDASVIINTSPKTAITPEDYTEPILNQRLNFFAGESEKNVSVNIVDDKLVEDDQTFHLSLTGVDGSTVFPDCKTSTVTIVSNDVNIFCRSRRGFQTVHEDKGPVVMEFTREGSLQYNHTMRILTKDGTAKSGDDYTAIDKTLTFAPYQTDIKENVSIVNDNFLESDETFSLSVTSSDDRVHMICPGTDFTILNDDTFIRCANQSIEASEGNKTVYFTLKREGVLNKASPIWFSTKDGTAFDKSDYKPRNNVTRTFLPGQVYMTLSVNLVDDEYNEDDETFSVIIGSRVPKTLTSGERCTVITIKDDDPNRMTEQQAQELLAKRPNFLIILGVAGGFMALVVIIFTSCVCYILRRAKKLNS